MSAPDVAGLNAHHGSKFYLYAQTITATAKSVGGEYHG